MARRCACEKCGTFDPDKFVPGSWISVKKDGVRVETFGKLFLSRDDKEYRGLEHLEELISGIAYGLDCEGIVPGHGFDGASGLFRNHSSVPDARLWVFDLHDTNLPIEERYKILERLPIFDNEFIELAPHMQVWSLDQVNEFYAKALADGWEGVVICKPNTFYKHDCRTQWFRLVPDKSLDLECINFYEGKGRLEGTLGGVIFNKSGIEIKVGTGKALNDKTRADIWNHKYKFLGKVGKIIYKSEYKSGKLRQPRLELWRDDKQPDYR